MPCLAFAFPRPLPVSFSFEVKQLDSHVEAQLISILAILLYEVLWPFVRVFQFYDLKCGRLECHLGLCECEEMLIK